MKSKPIFRAIKLTCGLKVPEIENVKNNPQAEMALVETYLNKHQKEICEHLVQELIGEDMVWDLVARTGTVFSDLVIRPRDKGTGLLRAVGRGMESAVKERKQK